MEIKRKDKIFVAKGEINASNVSQFKERIKTLLKFNSELIINVEKVNAISLAGIKAIIELNLFAFKQKKIFLIEGKQLSEFYKKKLNERKSY
ncbi:STAS domain-containing protein [Tamlana sp. 62-3]|uniref:STAS domain-containing protein n=1 Tax=Neotamlana sargassicola TaxID=2883125 RepID=A0A9X1L495_9FLAO|nr:STAS domain-containing protein [Tamlana sargassicola]MCB4807982.1 STAS domain-containing protein [Tamlana sargassicola]